MAFLKKIFRGYRGLKGKFFLALTATVLGVIIAIFLVLNYFLRQQVLNTLDYEVRRAAKLFVVLHQRERVQQMLARSRVLASAPHLKAALDTGDQPTVQDVLEKFFPNVSTGGEENFPRANGLDVWREGRAPSSPALQENDKSAFGQINEICVVFDRDGKIWALATKFLEAGWKKREASTRFDLPDSALISTWRGQERFTIWRNHDEVWWGVAVPILAGGSPLGPAVIGGLVLGTRLDDAFAQRMKELVGAEVAFLVNHELIAASIFNQERLRFARAIPEKKPALSSASPHELNTANENLLAVTLPWLENDAAVQVVLFRSIDRSIQPLLRPVQRTLFIVGLGAFLAALAISLIISRNITQPIAKLVDAAHAAGAGQLDQPIRIASRDEIGYLARRFEAMRQSIKQQMEKLTELNASLVERNVDLESALAQLRRAQEELVKSEKLAAAGKLTAQLSHEINNPIHNIRSCLETALKKTPDGLASRQFVQIAHDEILRIGKLVRQMLDFYRFGQIELHAVDLNAALVEVLESSQRRFEERRIEVARDLAQNLPAVRASRDQMKQVFLNLILNAIEAMPHGGKLETKSRRENGCAQIEIRDTGCGIPPENLAKIFDTFFTTKRAVHGVGLGLSVCYNIVHQHGGTIEVKSEMGRGSAFTVKLPLENQGEVKEH